MEKFTKAFPRDKTGLIFSNTLLLMIIGIIYLLPKWNFHFDAVIIGGMMGLVIGLVSSVVEILLFANYYRRIKFYQLLLLRLIFYFLLISGTITFFIVMYQSYMQGSDFEEAFYNVNIQAYLFSTVFFFDILFVFAIVFLISFIRQINRLFGRNILLYFITGKYHQPIEENRIFMFLDIKGSTAIAEKLGHRKYHNFLNEFFFDITPAIVQSNGEIYQYIGDEVVVTWTEKKGLHDYECIKCFFRVTAIIQLLAEKYRTKYGLVPEFKAGMHYGPVIIGEIGDIKREIVFNGDTMNAGARIQSECNNYNRRLLLSADLLKKLGMNNVLTPEYIGKLKLRGKESETELYGIMEAE